MNASSLGLLVGTWLGMTISPTANATTLPGGVVGNQTWNLAGSPYTIQGDLTVLSGATLTIEAGVEVRFDTGDSQASGVDASKIELRVEGALDVDGTSLAPVTFSSSSSSSAGAW